MASNKRNFSRIAMKAKMTTTGITTTKGNDIRKSYQLTLEDLSASGLRYCSRFAIPVATKLDLVFQLEDRKVFVTAEVVRSQRNEFGLFDIGCKFIDIDRLDQESIIKYITLSSVRDAKHSVYYSPSSSRTRVNIPMGCSECRCADCAENDKCQACSQPKCGKRFCRMYMPSRNKH